jgi:DNA-binding NarL/FixJ family response regulator
LPAENREITVLVADDQELIRLGYKAILDTYPDIKSLGAAATGAQAIEMAQQLRPDVVLMDIRMPDVNGIEATRAITANPLLPNTRVLVLTTFDIDSYVYDALGAGASGFLLKDADPDEIAQAVRIVARGDALIQPSVMRRLVQNFVSAVPAGTEGALSDRAREMQVRLKTLTDREKEVLRYVASGLSNEEIAEKFIISPATVKTHVSRIMAKVGAHDRAQLVIFAYESRLISPAK